MSTQRSVVKWFDAKKGFGFIVHPRGGRDIFVHYSQILTEKRFKTLRTGQVVEYQLEDGPKGPHAVDVELIEDTMDGQPEANDSQGNGTSEYDSQYDEVSAYDDTSSYETEAEFNDAPETDEEFSMVEIERS